jgi:hypothetical protein
MWAWRLAVIGLPGLGLVLAVGCGRQSTVPATASGQSSPTDGEQLPFDREGQTGGISPSSAVIPPRANVPAGTPVTIRLGSAISSASVRTGDTFDAVLDEPIVANGQTVAERGAVVTGRIMESTPARNDAPGYLRLALISIVIRGNSSPVQTSSNFLKGGRRQGMIANGVSGGGGKLMGAVAGTGGKESALRASSKADSRERAGSTLLDVSIGPERQFTFRLTAPVPLHP